MLRDGDGFIVVYSLNNDCSYNEIKAYFDKIIAAKEKCWTCSFVLVGNKSGLDNNNHKASMLHGMDLAEALHIRFMETSVEEKINVDECFLHVIEELQRKTLLDRCLTSENGSSLFIPDQRGVNRIMRKIAQRGSDLLQHELETYIRLRQSDAEHNYFPMILEIEDNYAIPPSFQTSESGSHGSALVMEYGSINLFEYIEAFKLSCNMMMEVQNILGQILNIIQAIHQSGLVWLD